VKVAAGGDDDPHGTSSTEGTPGSFNSTARGERDGKLTITEAAQIKGVSYHTVSRAIRRGRLPVQRLGRMALISEEDLAAWRPMRERAPRKYRQTGDDQSPAAQLDAEQSAPVDLATRLSSYYEEMHLFASESSLSELVALVSERFAEALGLSRVGCWLLDDSANVATRVGSFGTDFEPVPWRFALSEVPFVPAFARTGQTRIVLDAATELGVWDVPDGTAALGSVVVAPLRVRSRPIGVIFGDRHGRDLDLTQEQLALSHRLANQIALAVEYNRSLRAESRHAYQLSTVLDEVDATVIACDAQGRIMFVNTRHRELSGHANRDAESLIGMDARTYLALNESRRFHLDGRPFPLDEHPLLRAIAGDTAVGVEYAVVQADGTRITILASGRPIIVDGEFLGAVSTGRELTEERQILGAHREEAQRAATRLKRNQRLHQLAVDLLAATSANALYEASLAHLAAETQADFCSFFRSERGGKIRLEYRQGRDMPAVGPRIYDLMALPSTALAIASGYPTVLQQSQTLLLEDRIQRESNVATSLVIPLNIGDRTLGVLYANFTQSREIATDIYEHAVQVSELVAGALQRLTIVESMEASRQQLLSVIDQLPTAMLIVSYPDGLVQIANRAAEALWGRPLRDGTTRADQLSLNDGDGMPLDHDQHPLLRSLHTGLSYLGEPLTVRRDDGSDVDVLANHTPIYDANALIQGSVSVLQERAAFKPLDRARDEFLSVVAHEIRNPLTSLRGNLQLLQRRVRKAAREDMQDELRRIHSVIDQVDRIADLVSRMLDISRADLGKLDISLRDTDGSLIVQQVVDEVSGQAPDRPFLVTAPERLPVVWDEGRVRQILVNLVTNAVRYAPEGPIEVTLQETSDLVTIAVRDHGHGVPPRLRKRLFNQYYRFDDGQDSQEIAYDGSRGLGIGLYISARLAREHGGTLAVEDADGGGAVFTLTLPRNAERARSGA
jgi:excisionase family DNA binding protein/PAS domain S-box-containing protein